jgi:hypothetical protein
VRQQYALPTSDHIKPSQVDAFGRELQEKLLANKDSPISKRYLTMLVDEIVVNGKTATMAGSHAAEASMLRV